MYGVHTAQSIIQKKWTRRKSDGGPIAEDTKAQVVSWNKKIIINPDNKIKAIFDIFILFLVGYSCVTTVYKVAFQEQADNHSISYYWD